MKITEVKDNKKQYLPLLLLADEQVNMIDRYLEKGTMYVLEDQGIKASAWFWMLEMKFWRSRILRLSRDIRKMVTEKH